MKIWPWSAIVPREPSSYFRIEGQTHTFSRSSLAAIIRLDLISVELRPLFENMHCRRRLRHRITDHLDSYLNGETFRALVHRCHALRGEERKKQNKSRTRRDRERWEKKEKKKGLHRGHFLEGEGNSKAAAIPPQPLSAFA